MNEIKKYVQIPIVSCVGKKDFLITDIVSFLKQKYEVTVDAQMISIREIVVPETGTEPESPIKNTELDAGDMMAERAAEDAEMEQQKILDEEEGKAKLEDDTKAQEEMEQEQEEKGKEEVKWGEE